MKGEIMFNNAHTTVISHYCVFTETLPRLIHRGFWLLRLCRGCGFRPTAVNLRQPLLAKTRFTACKWSHSFERYCICMAGLRSRAKFGVSTWWHKFVTLVHEVRSADNEILLPQAQVTSFGNRFKRGTVFQDLSTDLKIYVCLLQFPNMLT